MYHFREGPRRADSASTADTSALGSETMTVLVLNAAATWAMVGLIWTIQMVHYPQLATLSELQPAVAVADHQRRITPVVGPPMAVEGVTTVMLLVARPDEIGAASAWIGASLLAVALGSTVLVQVPIHRRLSGGHDGRTARQLVETNWIRTIAWSLRGILLAAVLIA